MRKHNPHFDYLIAVTGASGAVYAHRLISELLGRDYRLGLIFSDAGQKVFAYEMNLPSTDNRQDQVESLYATDKLTIYDNQQLFAAPASGSGVAQALVIIPASMGTIARIAQGNSANLLERAADVYLKEYCPLLLVPRETPLNAIHLENMLKLSRLGARIIPAMPGFYHHPASLEDVVNFVVGKVLDALDIEHDLYPPWNG